MKKLVFASFAALALLLSGVAEAGGGHGHGGGRGSGRGGHGYGGGHGGGGGYYRGGYRGPYRGGYGRYYRAGWGGGWGWGGGVAIYPRVVVGGGPYWWGNPYRYYGAGYPYYGLGVPYAVPYYPQPVIVQPAQPQVYVQQAQPAPQYWHYCEDPKGYYPYVETCRGEWLQVVPRTESAE